MSHAASLLEIQACAESGHKLTLRVNLSASRAQGATEKPFREGATWFYKTCRCGRRYQWNLRSGKRSFPR